VVAGHSRQFIPGGTPVPTVN